MNTNLTKQTNSVRVQGNILINLASQLEGQSDPMQQLEILSETLKKVAITMFPTLGTSGAIAKLKTTDKSMGLLSAFLSAVYRLKKWGFSGNFSYVHLDILAGIRILCDFVNKNLGEEVPEELYHSYCSVREGYNLSFSKMKIESKLSELIQIDAQKKLKKIRIGIGFLSVLGFLNVLMLIINLIN